MLQRFGVNRTSAFDAPIEKVLASMETYGPEDPEFKRCVKYLERLEKLKAGQRRERIKSDTILIVVGNVLIVLIIVGYEHNHPMLSKALGFIHKPKV